MTTFPANEVSVAIIGAGISGLRCADILLRSGVKVKIYEARNRIGGRVHHIPFGGHLVDLGANWIHSPNGSPIKKLAEHVKAVTFPRPKNQAIVGSDGKRKSDAVAIWMHEKRLEVIEKASKYSSECSQEIDANASLMDFFKDEISKELSNKPEILQDMLNEAQRWGQMVGEPVDQQSLKFLCIEEGPGGTDLFVASSYQDILALISKLVLEKNAVKLGAEVKQIISETTSKGRSIAIKTVDGTRDTFDEVVVTCPLGWLKQNKESAFSPALPPRLSQAIDNINYGRLEKIYVSFPAAFWLDSSESNNKPPCFTHFHDPSYVSHPSTIPSNLIAISLAHLPRAATQPTLLFYMHGPCTTRLLSSVKNHSPHSDAYNTILEEFIHPYYSRMPGYSPNNPSCKPISYRCTMWQFDRFAGCGSYSHFQKGVENAAEDVEVIREAGGMGDTRGVWLAGEHTAPFGSMATTTGAYISGERVAERICRKRGVVVVKEIETDRLTSAPRNEVDP
ncbi:hypothetical protein B7463_g9183, partial [Scytalidium lignicola]